MKFTNNLGKPSMTKKNYSGADLDAVAKAMDKNGFWGRYISNIQIGYNMNENGVVHEITITGTPEIIMPVWKGWNKADRESQKAWDIMWVRLKRHEENHYKKSLEELKKFEKKVKKAGAYSESVFKTKMDDFYTDHQKVQDAYDKKTDHGVKEGVVL